ATGRLQIQAWLAEQGIPADAVVDVGVIPNHLVAPIIREADVALFPNRAEGGTNLAAMESLACGLPTILSANTGHLDLLGDAHCYPLRHQGSVRPTPLNTCVEGWGESDLEEILAYLEQIHGDRPGAQARGQAAAQVMQDWTWERQVQRLMQHLQPFMHPSSG
ncbi:MAG: glycosyltransferase, partial [Elainellaceae cyanobacterium]